MTGRFMPPTARTNPELHVQSAHRSTLISQVTDQLRAEIGERRWTVGTKIPPEPALAELTGTGRNTVREAVQALVHAGLLQRRQGLGTFVVADSELTAVLGRHLALSHHRDVLELRQALDVQAAALAAQRRDVEDVAELRRLVTERRCAAQSGDSTRYAAADLALHRGVVVASHNGLYLEFYDSLRGVFEPAIHDHVASAAPGYHAEHEELADAVIAGNPERAAAAARHLLDALRACA